MTRQRDIRLLFDNRSIHQYYTYMPAARIGNLNFDSAKKKKTVEMKAFFAT